MSEEDKPGNKDKDKDKNKDKNRIAVLTGFLMTSKRKSKVASKLIMLSSSTASA